jgi:hypothetical protein
MVDVRLLLKSLSSVGCLRSVAVCNVNRTRVVSVKLITYPYFTVRHGTCALAPGLTSYQALSGSMQFPSFPTFHIVIPLPVVEPVAPY